MPICVINSKTIKLVVAMILVAIILAISFNGMTSAQVFFGYNTKKVPIYAVETTEKTVAISFDSAWGAEKTLKIVETLQEYNCNATFFLVGFWVDKYPEMVKAIDNAGIEIGSHSNTHPDLTTLNATQIREELTLCGNMITAITNKSVELFRCPYGAYNNTVLDVVGELNMIPIQWSVDSLDWKGLSAESITSRVLNKVENGSIILCHNNADNILDALTMILDRLTMQGYKVVSVGELISHSDYTIDRNGIQHKNKIWWISKRYWNKNKVIKDKNLWRTYEIRFNE